METPSPASPVPPPMPTTNQPKHGAALVVGFILLLVIAGGFYYYKSHPPLTPENVAVLNAVAKFNANDLDGALAEIDKALAINPNSAPILAYKSIILSQKGSLLYKEAEYGAQAADVASQAIIASSTYSEAYRALGYAYEIQSRSPQAYMAYEEAIKLDPKNSLALYDLAHTYDIAGYVDKAESYYTAALAADPNSYPAHLGLARIANGKGDADGAIMHFKVVYDGSPNVHDRSEAAFSLGMLLIGKGDTSSSLMYMNRATTLDPNYASGWFGLGVVNYVLSVSSTTAPAGRGTYMVDSINALTKSISLSKYQSLAYLQYAEDAWALKRDDAAFSALDTAEKVLTQDTTLTPTERKNVAQKIKDYRAIFKKGR